MDTSWDLKTAEPLTLDDLQYFCETCLKGPKSEPDLVSKEDFESGGYWRNYYIDKEIYENFRILFPNDER